jgi:uncharacterized RDD family membrane protein YckC
VRVDGADTRIVTPEAVVLELEPATVGSRGVALVVDVLILGTVSMLLFLAEGALGFGGFVPGWFGIALLLVLGFAVQFGYPIGFETLWGGRTPGKAALGLRVVTVEGAPVGVRHATIRAAVGLVELTATVGGVAAIVSIVSARGQRLGDLAAGTLVVRERRATGAGIEAETFAPPPGLESYAASLDVTGLASADYATVRDVLRRATSLGHRARQQVAEQVADVIATRVTPPPPAGLDALRYLTCVGAAVQRRSGSSPAAPSSAVGSSAVGSSAVGSSAVGSSARASPAGASPPDPSATWGVDRPSPAHADPSRSTDSTGGFAPPS